MSEAEKINDSSINATEVTPVTSLKELVARLHREQNKIQDLLSSLGFALRSFNNLNQFLELIPLMATRVTDADGSALFLYRPNGQVRLEQLHWQDSRQRKNIRKALETVSSQFTYVPNSEPLAINTGVLDDHMHRFLGPDIQNFGTAILVKHTERGWLYVLSQDPEFTWTETRQKLVRLIADQTAVAIENDELATELRKKERLDQELEIGTEIQRRLLPRQYPTIPGVALAARCKPANRVGGDYYDFIPINHNLIFSPNTNTNKVKLQFPLTLELYSQLQFRSSSNSDSISTIVEEALASFLADAAEADISENQKEQIYACENYDKLLEINPKDYKAWYARGVLLKNLGRYEEAIASLDKALEIKPDYHKAWYAHGNALYDLDFYEEAIASLDKAIELKPDYAEAWYCRAKTLDELDRQEEAKASYAKVREFKPQVGWALVIGDVMGKGVPAGLIMTMIRGALRAMVLNSHSPSQIMENLNRVMYADLENSHRFVTMFYSEYNPVTRILSYTNAAHNPPMWWHAATKTVTRLDSWGMLIGLDANSQYEDARAQLEPGDTILYYTDGLTDAASASGDRFDEENLLVTFNYACKICNRPEEIIDYLFDQVQQFIGEERQNTDDMTLIVLQVQ